MRIVNSWLLCTQMKDFLTFIRELESRVGFPFFFFGLVFCNLGQRNFEGSRPSHPVRKHLQGAEVHTNKAGAMWNCEWTMSTQHNQTNKYISMTSVAGWLRPFPVSGFLSKRKGTYSGSKPDNSMKTCMWLFQCTGHHLHHTKRNMISLLSGQATGLLAHNEGDIFMAIKIAMPSLFIHSHQRDFA